MLRKRLTHILATVSHLHVYMYTYSIITEVELACTFPLLCNCILLKDTMIRNIQREGRKCFAWRVECQVTLGQKRLALVLKLYQIQTLLAQCWTQKPQALSIITLTRTCKILNTLITTTKIIQ